MARTPATAPLPEPAFTIRSRDRDTKRDTVLRTAARLFLETSYSRTSLDDVAACLNITKPALYHYFRNKEELLLECYRMGTDLIEAGLEEIDSRAGNGLEKVRSFIRSYAVLMTVDYGRCVAHLDDGELSPKTRAEVRGRKRRIDHRLRSFVEEGIEDASIGPCNPKLVAFAISGALNWIGNWYAPEGQLKPQAIANDFAAILTQGLENHAAIKTARPKTNVSRKKTSPGSSTATRIATSSRRQPSSRAGGVRAV
ncbi:MAG: TetR/AcrR family transcriptional regulator [Acidobacteriaceae bacterium]